MQEIVYNECQKIHMTMVKTYKGLAELSLLQGKTIEAKNYLEKATSILEQLKINRTSLGEFQAISGSIYFFDGDLKDAEETFKEGWHLVQSCVCLNYFSASLKNIFFVTGVKIRYH